MSISDLTNANDILDSMSLQKSAQSHIICRFEQKIKKSYI